MSDSLKLYREKRNFTVTSEPAEGGESVEGQLAFVIQKHWASRLHYDFRLELDGAMKSWAVPKGPSYDPKDKRMAVQVEDHPIAYNRFEGEIPAGQYGAGKVIIWDEGTWTPLEDPHKGWRDGMLKFEMHGRKMHGKWALIRMKDRGEKQPPWLLIKEKDALVRPAAEFSVVDELPDSVVPLRDPPPAPPAAAKAAKKAKAADPSKATDTTDTTNLSKPANTAKPAKPSKTAMPAASPIGKAARLPDALQPQLATLVDRVPAPAGDWLFEIKFDGYRVLSRIEAGEVRLITRNGHDWTHKMPHLAEAIGKLKIESGWLDGEIVVTDERGVPDFQALQNAFDSSRTASIAMHLFDMPFFDGRDLRSEPLERRRELLASLFDDATPDVLRFSDVFDVRPDELVTSACRLGLEGVIGKLRSSTYSAGRSASWIKLKCIRRQEFVIAGWTDPKGARSGIGSLLLAVHDADGKLQYAGNVGTGFNAKSLADIRERLDAVAAAKSPLATRTDLDRTAHWVRPELVAEVSFGEWTSTGRIRHSVFHGVRTDKSAKVIIREEPVPAKTLESDTATRGATTTKTTAKSSGKPAVKTSARPVAKAAGRTAAKGAKAAGEPTSAPKPGKASPSLAAGAAEAVAAPAPGATLKLTHPERVIDASTGITKLELARYYALVAPLLLPHLKARPVSLVRAPDGIEGQLFFQKHLESKMPGVKALDPALDPDHAPLLEVPSAQALMSAAQMNVVEFHTWNAVKTSIGKPDRMTFDLDPGEGVAWSAMQQAAGLVRVFLTELGLASHVKTSGGKGMHVVVPIKKQYDWDTVKSFSQAVVQHLSRTLPQLFVAKSGPKNRIGKIFIDYLRNGFGATTASAWSARSRPGMGVSVPIAWDEVDTISSGAHWHVRNIHERLDRGNAPWDDYAAQPVAGAMKALDFDPKAG